MPSLKNREKRKSCKLEDDDDDDDKYEEEEEEEESLALQFL